MIKKIFDIATSYLSNKHLLSFTGNLLVQALNIIYFALLFRHMKVEELGAFVFFNSMLGLAESIRSGFITTAFVRAYCGATLERAAEVIGSSWTISLVITLIIIAINIIAILIFGSLANPGMNLFIKWSGITLLLMLPSFVATCILQAEQHFDKLLYLRASQLGLSVIGLLVLILIHQVNLTTLICSNLIAAAITSAVTLAVGWTRISDIRYQTLACVKELAHFGKYSVSSQIGSTLLTNSDVVIINYVLGPGPLAVYNLAQRFMMIIQLLISSSIATAVPELSLAYSQGNKNILSHLLMKYIGFLTWIILPIIALITLLAEIPVYLLGGNNYIGSEATNLLRIFISMSILFPIDRFTGVALDIINKPALNTVKVGIMLLINVAGDFIGLRIFNSVYGVAIASIATVLSGAVFGYIQFNKEASISLTGIMRAGLIEVKAIINNFIITLKTLQKIQ